MKTPKVSVLMSVYNTPETYLRDAVESILNQTFKDFEFIIVDDGSDKIDVKKVCNSYRDKRIKYFYKKNSGLADSLNFGLDHCVGQYVARMDSDDISLPTRLAEQVKYMDANTNVGVLGTWFQMFGTDNKTVKHPTHIKILNLLHDQHVGHPTVMLRKSLFDKYDLRYNTDYTCAQDFELWSRAVFVMDIANLPCVLLKYRMSSTNVSSVHRQKQRENAQKVKQNILARITDNVELRQEIYDIIWNKTSKRKIYLFHILPIMKIKQTTKYTKYYLFGFLPIIKIKKGKV